MADGEQPEADPTRPKFLGSILDDISQPEGVTPTDPDETQQPTPFSPDTLVSQLFMKTNRNTDRVQDSYSPETPNTPGEDNSVSVVPMLSDEHLTVDEPFDPSDVPPLPLDYPRSESEIARLQRRRIHNERLRVALRSEQDAYEQLSLEEDQLVTRANRTTEMIITLAQKSEHLDERFKSVDELYRVNQQKLKLLHEAVDDITKQWQSDANEYNSHSSKLQKLRQQKTRLECEVIEVAGHCANLTAKLTQALQEKSSLEENISRTNRLNDEMRGKIDFTDKESQTSFSFNIIQDIENIHAELKKQRTTMKSVRQALDLVRRCT
jgi:DNA repair exonuclease SbcCD ATPase subunit